PASVRGLSVRQTPGAVLLTWSANEDADLRGYQVFRSAGDAQTFVQLAPTGESSMSQTSYADGDIRPGTAYWYRVRAVDRSGNVGAFSDAVEAFVEDLLPPPKVLNLRGDIRSDNAIRLRWSPVDDPSFAGYMLERSLTPEDSASFWFRLADTLRDTVFIDTLWDYQEGKVSYRVRAYDYSDNRGPWSDVATLRPPDDVPPSPPLLLELRVVEDGIEIQWELVGVADLAGYHVWRSQEKAGNYTRITQQMLPDTITLYREKPPAYGKVYWYRVSALDRDGNESAPGNPLGSVYIDRAPPPAPENLTAESLREGVRLSWTPPKSPDLEGYNIYRNDGDDGPMQLLDQLPRAGNAFTDRTAELGKTYIYEVAAYDRKYNIGPRAGPLTVTFEVEQDDRK
ncbi:MAG TPA: hypothetical protein VLB27_09360, partial [candidate division Zixibacteria bacterium]|nr:hypothetical protein [candidate division Zixibacteria bacterium]